MKARDSKERLRPFPRCLRATAASGAGRKQLAAGLILLLLCAGCVTQPSAITGESHAYAYTWSQERQMGQQSDQQIIRELGVYQDENLEKYVSYVGHTVLNNSDLRQPDTPDVYTNSPFTFRVMDSPVVNAFALPGGFVYVTRGLLTHLENEAQLAVVLGHEIAHVAARHASQQALKAEVGQLGLIAGAILGQQIFDNPNAAGNILNIGGTVFQLLLTKYSRDAEREADQLGVEYAARGGYKVSEAAPFFDSLKRLQQQQGIAIPPWQSTHPDPGEREQTILKLANQWSKKFDLSKVRQSPLYQQLEGVVMGKNPREGFVENNTFYHPELKFQFPVPSTWKVQNERAAVLMAAPEQRAILVLELANAASAQAAAQELTRQQGIQVVDSGATEVNGLTAYRMLAQGATQRQKVALLNYFIEYDGKVYSLLGYTTVADFPQYQQVFASSMTGFKPVNDPSILNAQPARVHLVTVSQPAPFSSFLPDKMPWGLTPRDVAILNQVKVTDTIPAGTVLKLPSPRE